MSYNMSLESTVFIRYTTQINCRNIKKVQSLPEMIPAHRRYNQLCDVHFYFWDHPQPFGWVKWPHSTNSMTESSLVHYTLVSIINRLYFSFFLFFFTFLHTIHNTIHILYRRAYVCTSVLCSIKWMVTCTSTIHHINYQHR